MPVELALTLILIALLTLPGWALLTIGDTWRRWEPLQRWCLAIGLSIAVYPVVFYAVRSLLPAQTLGPVKLVILLGICGGRIVWRMRGHWREWFVFDRLEWLAIGLIGATLFTRFWIIRDQPYPAWSDSLHHVLLTQLTAWQGKLPTTMEPYFPIALGQYHLGLYALSGSAQMLSGAPAHTALLWTAQALNGLCGLGIYLALDRKVGRWGAVVGAAVVGLMSFQPAWYVNWGRFTQVSSQTILLIAWIVTWQAIATCREARTLNRGEVLWNIAMAAVLNGAVFLLHFRVAAFYLPLLAISVLWEFWRAYQARQLKWAVIAIALTAACSLAVVMPALQEALQIHQSLADASVQLSPQEREQAVQGYYVFPLRTVPLLVARPWLLGVAGLSLMWGWMRRSGLSIAIGLWVAVIIGLGYTYLLDLPALNITNLGAILIMLYIPMGLAVGVAAEEVLRALSPAWRQTALRLMVMGLLLMSVVMGRARAVEKEPNRYFVSSADVAAMEWIRANTPADAVFAINTYFWLPAFPHGTDAGYWIPYFTGRQTTASSMLFGFSPAGYRAWVVASSHAVERLPYDLAAVAELKRLGVGYIYVGAKGDFSGTGLDGEQLSEMPGLRPVYHQDPVWVFEVDP